MERGQGKHLRKRDKNIWAMQWEAGMLEPFYPWWNLDYKSPAGIFVCWRFSLFQKGVHSDVCVWADGCVFVLLSNIYQASIRGKAPTDLKMDPLHGITMVKRHISETTTNGCSSCYVFYRASKPGCTCLLPPLSRNNLEWDSVFCVSVLLWDESQTHKHTHTLSILWLR